MAPPTTPCYVCVGKDCRRSKGHAQLLDALRDVTVELVPCQDICKGPVAGVEVSGTLQWFRRVRKARRRRALAALVADRRRRRVPRDLADRTVKKRTGKLRRFSRRQAA